MKLALIIYQMKKLYKPKDTILFLDGSKLIKTDQGDFIVEAQARYGNNWCIYKTEYSSFGYN